MEKTKRILIPLLGGVLLPGPILGTTSPDSTPIPLVVQSAEPDSFPVDHALHFDGMDDRVNLGNAPELTGLSAFTVALWVKVDTLSAWRTFFSKRVNNYNRIQFQQYRTPGNLGVAVSSGKTLGYYHTIDTPLTTGTWYHLAMVFDGSRAKNGDRLRILVNGVSLPLAPHRGDSVPSTTPRNNAPVLLGAERSDGAWGLTGAMDNVRIWSEARSDEEMRADMGKTQPDRNMPTLLAAYDFEDAQGTRLTDILADRHGRLRKFSLQEGSGSTWIVRAWARRTPPPVAPLAVPAPQEKKITASEPSAPATRHVPPEPLAPPAALPVVAQVRKREKGLYYVAGGAALMTAGIVGYILYFTEDKTTAAEGHDLGAPPETPNP